MIVRQETVPKRVKVRRRSPFKLSSLLFPNHRSQAGSVAGYGFKPSQLRVEESSRRLVQLLRGQVAIDYGRMLQMFNPYRGCFSPFISQCYICLTPYGVGCLLQDARVTNIQPLSGLILFILICISSNMQVFQMINLFLI